MSGKIFGRPEGVKAPLYLSVSVLGEVGAEIAFIQGYKQNTSGAANVR